MVRWPFFTESTATHANRGWTLLEQSRADEALGHFREALRLDPDELRASGVGELVGHASEADAFETVAHAGAMLCDAPCVDEKKVRRLRGELDAIGGLGAVAETFRVLGDSTRVSLVWALAQGEFSLIESSLRACLILFDTLGWAQEARGALGSGGVEAGAIGGANRGGSRFILAFGEGAMEHYLSDRPVADVPWKGSVAALDAAAARQGIGEGAVVAGSDIAARLPDRARPRHRAPGSPARVTAAARALPDRAPA